MNESFNLKSAKFPKIMTELSHSNQFLKFFSVSALVMTLLTLFVLALTVDTPPIVLTLSETGQILATATTAKPEEHTRAAINRYLELRYRWAPSEVKKNLELAKAFILPKNRKSFESTASGVVKFAIEKGVTQKVYLSPLQVSLPQKTAIATGDRITSIQGLKAASDLKLEVSFESGPPTQDNPWGIYITKEREE